MERYEAYKDSGIEWVGEIPAEWEVKKLKYMAVARPSNIDKKSKDEEEPVSLCNYVDVYKNEFISRELTFMRATAAQEQIEKFLLQKGDILATKDSESPDDIANPALVVEDFDGIVCGYHLTHIKPKKIMGSYLFRYFQTNYLNSYFEVSANGVTRYGLGVDKFNSALILNPSMDEQTDIANFLDRKTAEIDALIVQKECLLELYEEEKTAIINHAVTKGLNPNAELKDSGVKWLGDIPDGWEMKKLVRIVEKLTNGYVGPTREIMRDSGVPYIQGIHIKDNSIRFTPSGNYYVEKDWSINHSKSILKTDDLLVVQTGSIGDVGIVEQEFDGANCHALLIVRVINDHILPKYLLYYLSSPIGFALLQKIKTGEILFHINGSKLKGIDITLPPLNEQAAIVQYIEAETARIDAKIAKTQRIIELQKEYRTALISEMVTGKIKVPELPTQEASA